MLDPDGFSVKQSAGVAPRCCETRIQPAEHVPPALTVEFGLLLTDKAKPGQLSTEAALASSESCPDLAYTSPNWSNPASIWPKATRLWSMLCWIRPKRGHRHFRSGCASKKVAVYGNGSVPHSVGDDSSLRSQRLPIITDMGRREDCPKRTRLEDFRRARHRCARALRMLPLVDSRSRVQRRSAARQCAVVC